MAQGSRGPRSYRFNALRVRTGRRDKPGAEAWAIYLRNLNGLRNVNGAEPRHCLSNAPAATPPETPACVGGSRWRIEMEFETEKGDVGLDEYETLSWGGWHRHIAMCLPGGAFLIGLQQAWGQEMPQVTRQQVCRWCGRCRPEHAQARMGCCCGWRIGCCATNGRSAPRKDAAQPAMKAGWNCRLETMFAALESPNGHLLVLFSPNFSDYHFYLAIAFFVSRKVREINLRDTYYLILMELLRAIGLWRLSDGIHGHGRVGKGGLRPGV